MIPRGRSKIGCLFTLLILAAVTYFGVNMGESYWRFYRYRDVMQQEAGFARNRTNEQILVRLRAKVDSLDLPDEAKRISIRRTSSSIIIEAVYIDLVEMPMYVREIRYHPRAEGPL